MIKSANTKTNGYSKRFNDGRAIVDGAWLKRHLLAGHVLDEVDHAVTVTKLVIVPVDDKSGNV